MKLSCLLEFTRQINTAYSAYCEGLCQKFRISRTSFDILLFLANNPQFYTAKDVSSYRKIKPNVVSVHVDQLVSAGYLIRTAIPEDRRKIRLQCTELAAPLIREGQKMQRQFHEHLIAGISPEELHIFKHCFQVITENAAELPDAH